MTTTHRGTRSRRRVAGAAVLVLALAAACGDDSEPEIFSLDDEEAEGPGASDGDGGATDEELVLEWYSCMREHGVDMGDDPVFDEDGNIESMGVRIQADDAGLVEEAQAACPMPEAALPTGDRPDQSEMEDTALELAECVRENGYPDMPDPDFGGNGGGAQMGVSPFEGVDPNDPGFQAAMDECQHILSEAGGIVMRNEDG